MADQRDLPRDLAWYQDRWEELMDLLPASTPDEVVGQVRALHIDMLNEEAEALEEMGLTDAENAKAVLERIFERIQELRRENQVLQSLRDVVGVDASTDLVEAVESLQERAETLEKQQSVLAEAGFERPEVALQTIDSMEQQLDELYNEKEATERTDADDLLRWEGDTFDQLQALLAREEKLQRELGVADPDDIVEIVEGLTDQLEEFYAERDADEASDSIFAPADRESTEAEHVLEQELGVSDPEAAVTMIHNLTDQLDELYTGRERLAELNLNGADDAIAMVKSMQQQLESLYESQERLSEHGIDGIDYALSVIESMEAQLSELYDERLHFVEENGVPDLEEATTRLQTLEEKLSTLTAEKDRLREKRNQLRDRLDELEDELGTGDPEAIADLVRSMESQLQDVYGDQEESSPVPPSPADDSLLPEKTLAQLETLDAEALNALSVGLFCLDDRGVVQRANEQALQWPDLQVATPEALVGASFFEEVAPAADNALFRGRFETGVDEGEMDEQFPYTYVGARSRTTNLTVRLHGKPDQSAYWIVFQVHERH